MDKPHLRRFSWYRSGFAHEPDRPSDGTKVDAGLVETVDLTGLDNGTLYYIRIFPYNEKKQYQTLIDGATTSATPNIGPAQVTNFQVTGSGASPVLTWTNPTDDPLYHETVVIQKVGSAPTSITDGTEIYRGTGTTVTATDLVRLEEYYWGVFTVDEAGSYRSPVTSEMYSYDFPDQPASENDYTEISTVYESGTFVVPEDGWFKVVVTGRGTAGTSCSLDSCHYNIKWIGCSAGDGGQAGGAAISIFQFFKVKKFHIQLAEILRLLKICVVLVQQLAEATSVTILAMLGPEEQKFWNWLRQWLCRGGCWWLWTNSI